MAKGTKKKETLTPEEKLQQALVPVEGQPYPVPGNWCWTKVGILSSLHRGVSYKKNDAHAVKGANDCLIMRGGNIGEGFIDIDADNVYVDKKLVADNQFIRSNDIIIVASTGSTKVIGRAGISSSDYDDVAFGAFLMLLRPFKDCLPRYMDLFFQSDLYRNRIRDLASGVNINNIRADYITEMPYPLPPLPEQQRIVARIESLFAKLDEVKEKAQAVVDGYEDRKAAILHKAFTGELTAKWREEKGLNLNWKNKRINEVSIPRAGFAFNSKKFCNSGFQIIRMGNLYAGELNLTRNPVFIDQKDIDSAILKRALIKDGDILITLTGTKYKRDYGYAVRISGIENLLVNQRILCLTPKDDIFPDYLLHYLCSDLFRNIFFSNETGGVNQGNVSSKFVENINIPFPDFNEQIQIAKMVNDFLNNETSIKFIAQSVLDQIDNMKKSILARAFRGELGTNDPADEPAVELLKKVLEEEN